MENNANILIPLRIRATLRRRVRESQLTSATNPGYLHVTRVEATFKQKG